MKNDFYIPPKSRRYNPNYNKQYKKKNYNNYIIAAVALCILVGVGFAASPYILTYVEQYTHHGVEEKLFHLFNEDRSVYGVHPVVWDGKLASRGYARAVEMAQADIDGKPLPIAKGYLHEDVFIVTVDDFERRYYYSPQFVVDKWRNTNYDFRLHELDRDHIYVGIGVAKASNNNYYIVIEWSAGENLDQW